MVTCRLEATAVVAMAAGFASEGAAIDVNAAEANAPAMGAAAVVPDVAQPASKELTDMAPSGSMGALARNLSA